MTTAKITHATPACVYAHSADRNWEASSTNIAQAAREAIEHYIDDPVHPQLILWLASGVSNEGGSSSLLVLGAGLGLVGTASARR